MPRHNSRVSPPLSNPPLSYTSIAREFNSPHVKRATFKLPPSNSIVEILDEFDKPNEERRSVLNLIDKATPYPIKVA